MGSGSVRSVVRCGLYWGFGMGALLRVVIWEGVGVNDFITRLGVMDLIFWEYVAEEEGLIFRADGSRFDLKASISFCNCSGFSYFNRWRFSF